MYLKILSAKCRPFCRDFNNITHYSDTSSVIKTLNFTDRTFPLQWRHNEHDGVSNHQHHDCLLNRLFRRRSKKISKLCASGLCEGNSPVTSEFHTKMTSNVEKVAFLWRHHVPSVSLTYQGLNKNPWYSPDHTSDAISGFKNRWDVWNLTEMLYRGSSSWQFSITLIWWRHQIGDLRCYRAHYDVILMVRVASSRRRPLSASNSCPYWVQILNCLAVI